jgi:hypothetical protein
MGFSAGSAGREGKPVLATQKKTQITTMSQKWEGAPKAKPEKAHKR